MLFKNVGTRLFTKEVPGISSGAIQIGQTAISTQAKNTIQDDIDAIIEIITNSADNFFGEKFTTFMENKGVDDYPALPSIQMFHEWQDQIEDNPFGEINISFRSDYAEIEDNGTGVPCSYIETRIKKFGRDVKDQIDMGNNPDFNRRGQFSRGLKEVLAWLHSKGDENDATIDIITTFENEAGELKSWEGKYIINHQGNEPFYFELIKPCTKVEEDDVETGTTVRLNYPTGFKIHSSSMLQKMRRHYKLQRIFREHKVFFKYIKGGKERIPPFLSLYDKDVLHQEKNEVQLPEDATALKKALGGRDTIEYEFKIYRVQQDAGQTLRPLYPSSPSTMNVRGVYVADHTTIYGRLLPGDNVLGTENLQGMIIMPALRTYSVLGSSLENYGLPAFTPSDRKDPNFNHPGFQVIYDEIDKTWREIVEAEAERKEEEMKKKKDEKTEMLEQNVMSQLNNIMDTELTEDGLGDTMGSDDGQPSSDGSSNAEGETASQTRKKTLFGPQRIAYGENINLYPGKRRRMVLYAHKDIVDIESTGNILVETSESVLVNEKKSLRTDLLKIPISDAEEKEERYAYTMLFQPSLQMNDLPKSITLSISLDFDDIMDETRKLILSEERAEFNNHWARYEIPENIAILRDDRKLSISDTISVKAKPPEASAINYIKRIIFETEDTIKQNRREFPQGELDRGWDITPIPSTENPNQTNYLFRIYCKSPFFCDTYDDSTSLPEQDQNFKSLLSTALSSAVSQAVIQNTEEQSEASMDIHTKKINQYIPVINKIISTPDILEQVSSDE